MSEMPPVMVSYRTQYGVEYVIELKYLRIEFDEYEAY